MSARSRIFGSSNRLTNNTNEFGSMAGLAPTATVRPNVTGLAGYKYYSVAANGVNWQTGAPLNLAARNAGCGLGNRPEDGRSCLKFLGLYNGVNQVQYYKPGRSKVLG